MHTLRQINRQVKERFQTEAKTVPVEIAEQITARAIEAVNSGEPHKITGGWVASPFYGKASIVGCLHLATLALRQAQLEAYNKN